MTALAKDVPPQGIGFQVLSFVLLAVLAVALAVMAHGHRPISPLEPNEPNPFIAP